MLIIVRKIWFEELRSGAKRVEYRRYGRTFNERVFYIGRLVAFAYRRDRVSRLTGVVTLFATVPLSEMLGHLPGYGGARADRGDRRDLDGEANEDRLTSAELIAELVRKHVEGARRWRSTIRSAAGAPSPSSTDGSRLRLRRHRLEHQRFRPSLPRRRGPGGRRRRRPGGRHP